MNYCEPPTCLVGSQLCDFCKKAVKVTRRHLWSRCSLLVADGLSPLDLQVDSARHQQLQDYFATFPLIFFPYMHRPHVPTFCSYCVSLAPKVRYSSKKGSNLGVHVLIIAFPAIFSTAARKQFKKLCKYWKDDEHWNM